MEKSYSPKLQATGKPFWTRKPDFFVLLVFSFTTFLHLFFSSFFPFIRLTCHSIPYSLYSFAYANVLLVLGELIGQGNESVPRRSAIPLIVGAIVTAQLMMAFATFLGTG
jgi:hypothetical protein